MATIDETIKNYIEMLSCEVDSSDEKGDSQQETQSLLDFHLWCLLQNKGLIEIVKEYLALSDEEKLDFAYEKVFTCGVRLIDFQYVIYRLFGEGESDFNEFLLLQTDFSLVRPIVKEDKKEESSISSPRIEQKPHEAYFSLVLRSCQEVGGEEKSFIELRSNLFFVKAFLQEILEGTKSINYIEEEGRFRIIDVSGVFDDCEIFKSEAARLNFAESEEENSIVIEGAEEQIESVYYGIRLFLPFVMVEVKKHNLFFKLKCRISELKNRFLGIKLQRLPLSEEVSKILDDHGCQYIQDLLALPMDKTNLNALEEILKCIEEMDQSTPGELLHVLMRRLKPSHELVIRMRFCGGNISTLEDVGSYFGVTRERIRQIEAKSIRFFNAPECRVVRSRIVAQMQMLCKFENFIAPTDFQTLELSKGELLFLEKCLEDIAYSDDFKVFFYSNASDGILMRALEDLPTYFTINDLEFYVEYLLTETDNRFSSDEIEYLLKVKYKRYGDYFSTGKLKLGIVIPYLVSYYFPNGLDIYDEKNIELLREKAIEHFDGFELSDSNRAITARIQSFCTPVGRGLWKYDIDKPLIGHALLDRIVLYLNAYNSPIVPISAIYQAFSEEMAELDITNKYHLQGQLKRVLPPEFKVNRDYVYRENGESFYRVVEEYIKQSQTVVTKRDLLKQFPGITDIVIQQVAAATRVVNMNGYFAHLDNLGISDEEIRVMKECIDSCIVDDSIYHSKAIYTAIKSKMSGLFARIGVSHYLQFFYLTRELLPTEYSYNRPFMAKRGVEIVSGEMQVLQKIQGKQEVSVSEVREFAREVGTIIDRYIEFADRNNDVLLIKDNETFINAEFLELDEALFANLDDIMLQFLGEAEYKPLTLFYDYWKLPKLKTKWTSWLLYSIINLYSKSYKTAVSSNYIADAVPLVVREGVEIDKNELEHIRPEMYSEYSDDEDELLDEIDLEDIV